jgi:DNA polymerase-1
LRLVQFGDALTGWTVPWQDWGGLVREVMRRYDGEWVFHNLKFDLHYLEREKAAPPRAHCHDTAVLAHLINPNGWHGLKPLANQYLDSRLSAGQDDLHTWMARKGWKWSTIPIDYAPYWSYAALDPVLTANLYEVLSPMAAPYKDAYDLELSVMSYVMDMETCGAQIDLEYCERERAELIKQVDEATLWVQNEYGCGVGDVAVAARLLKEGVILTAETPTGKWKLDAEILEAIDHPLAQVILKRRKAQRLSNAFFRNLINDNDNGVVHCDIKTLGARTSRMAVSRPALQQVPRGRQARDAFIPRQGNLLVDIDMDQIELRLTAHFTGDDGMIAAFFEADSTGGDIFTNMARMLTGDETLQKESKMRQDTKQAAYAKVYFAGVETFAHRAGVSVDEAGPFLASYDKAFPGVKQWQDKVIAVARKRLKEEGVAYVITPWGRRLTGDDDKLYALANYIIQGTAADFLKSKIVDLGSAGLLDYAVLPVHDELLFDVPADEAADFAVEAAAIMREDKRFAVPLTCKPAIGTSWGETHG